MMNEREKEIGLAASPKTNPEDTLNVPKIENLKTFALDKEESTTTCNNQFI